MNTYQFFNQSFGHHLVEQGNRPHMDAWKALTSTHDLTNKEGKASKSRLVGWAIIRPKGAIAQMNLTTPRIKRDERTRFEAFATELINWDGEPRMFLSFDKAPIPIANMFMTLDLRAVRVCLPGGVETFDFTKPAPADAGKMQRNIEKERQKNAS
jgi:hypothetical protein